MNSNYSFKYGKREINYFLNLQQRKSLSISVHPDKRIEIKAPHHASKKEVESRLKRKAGWIIRQLNYFEQFQPLTPQRKYINGETHLYLGKQYKLKVRKSIRSEVKLKNGYLTVYLNHHYDPNQIKQVLENWYKERAEIVIKSLYTNLESEFQKKKLNPRAFTIRKMQKRWGSCTPSKKVILNSDLIKSPKRCIEYVLIHEMCHLKYPNHNKSFYNLQISFLSDWEYLKNKLELIMS